MEEADARQVLIDTSQRLLVEWRNGHDWQWYGREGRWFDISELDDCTFAKDWDDYASLSTAWTFLDGFVDSMCHGFAKFDNLTWEDAVIALEDRC